MRTRTRSNAIGGQGPAPLRRRLTAALATLVLAFLLAPPAAGNGPAAEETCTPYFPLKDGWLGGDAAYSVALPDGRRLWLFGDTFIGEEGALTRTGATLIGNSVALSGCREGQWSVGYYWRRGQAGPAPVFVPPDATATTHEVRYWPLDGFVHDGALYVFLSRVRTEDADSVLGFAIEGVDLARVEGLERAPGDWRISYRPVLRGVKALPGAAVLPRDRHVLLYTPLTGEDRPERPLALARLPYDGLDAPGEHLRFLARDGSWRKGFKPGDAKLLMESGATELSVHRAGRDGAFVAVLNEAAFPADRIVLRTAPAPEGPWTDDLAIELIAERTALEGKIRQQIFCYAAKAYEPASAGTTLMLTYVCNSTDADVLLNNLDIYRPRAKRVMLPEAPGTP